MASINRQYHHGKSSLISSLTSDPHILEFADKLYSQAMEMELANESGRHFDYKPIFVPQNLRHIFGN